MEGSAGKGVFHTAVAAAVILALVAVSCAVPEMVVRTPDLRSLADGTYEGYHDGGMVKAKVAVEMRSGAIVSVDILEHRCGTGKPAEAIVKDVVESQSLDVDVVTGSTYSSRVILKAMEDALRGNPE